MPAPASALVSGAAGASDAGAFAAGATGSAGAAGVTSAGSCPLRARSCTSEPRSVPRLAVSATAVALAPIFTGQYSAAGKRVGVILSGGNVDIFNLRLEIEDKRQKELI